MFNSKSYVDFISSPLYLILEEACVSFQFLQGKMEEYPIKEYLLQNIFLKLCGALEQKLKCIIWEVATDDYDSRFGFISTGLLNLQCSSYDDKKRVYKTLWESCNKKDEDKTIYEILFMCFFSLEERGRIRNEWESSQTKLAKKECERDVQQKIAAGEEVDDAQKQNLLKGYLGKRLADSKYNEEKKRQLQRRVRENAEIGMKTFIESSGITQSYEHELDEFFENKNALFKGENFTPYELSFFNGDLKDVYDTLVYGHRNRCAHNVNSVQDNLPTLKNMCDKNIKFSNYYFRFYILLIIDEIFTKLFGHYQRLRSTCV